MIPLLLTLSLLLLLSLVSALRIYHYNEKESYIYIIVLVIMAFIVAAQIIRINQNIYRFFNRMEHSLEQTKCFTLYNTPDPIAITDGSGRILWYNSSFYNNIANGNDAFGMDFYEELDIPEQKNDHKDRFLLSYQNKKYNIECISNTDYSIKMNIFFFRDSTEHLSLLEEYNNKKPTVAIIAIDNYEDIFQNAKESERSVAWAKMESILENLTLNTNSFQKRLSKDRFLVVFEEQHLQNVIKERFRILDEARTISVGDEMCITLSIGVGSCSSSLAESELFAREALDMALGRGGDQAAVKTDNGYEFFGGLSKGVEKHSRTKTRIISNAMQKLFDNASNIFIMGHRFGDLDSIGSAIGLSAALEAIGKKSYIVVDQENNLAGDLIRKTQSSTLSLSFIDEAEALTLYDEASLLVVVDTHKKNIVESPALLEKIKNIIVIDHHRKDINYIDNALLFYHEPYVSSASEMIADVIPYFRNFTKLPSAAADALLAGIMLDTKNFVLKTGVRTFEAAAFLKKMGADTVSVKHLFSNSIEFYRMRSEIVSDAELYKDCAISIAHPKHGLVESLRIAAPQAADTLMEISSVKASFVIYESNDMINISARSYGQINVQLIMEKINGGGHLTMAAAQLKDVTLDEAKQLLIEALEKYFLENMTDTKTTTQKEN